ncbi:MAG: hypothetical protein K0S61_896 [Anaerocolumna sp.]|jgi:hypothetical protein|nr:hypothetical protein [Anaerocolumna sp.]
MSKKIKIFLFINTIIIVIILITFIVFLLNSKYTNKVKKTMEGVIISKDTGEVQEQVSVTINVKLDVNDKDTQVFRGEILISNKEYTQSKNAFLSYSVGYGEDGWDKRGVLIHPTYIWKEDKLQPHHAMTHWVEMDPQFSYLVLANYEEDGIHHDSGDTELIYNGTDIIVFPADDAASALKILEEHQVDKSIFTKTAFIDNKLIDVP